MNPEEMMEDFVLGRRKLIAHSSEDLAKMEFEDESERKHVEEIFQANSEFHQVRYFGKQNGKLFFEHVIA